MIMVIRNVFNEMKLNASTFVLNLQKDIFKALKMKSKRKVRATPVKRKKAVRKKTVVKA